MNPPKFRYVVCVALVLTAVACNGPDSVTAKKRTSKFKAVMASDEVSDSSEKPNNVNLDFFHPDHFACLTLNVPSVLENKDMSEIGWEQVEEQFAEFVGIENSSLENIERVWVVLDRTALDGMGMNP
ncbi:MAG: hypothetical protein AB8B55_18465, partial [Mariniblastus sp.]